MAELVERPGATVNRSFAAGEHGVVTFRVVHIGR